LGKGNVYSNVTQSI